jgi:hypothetical protein
MLLAIPLTRNGSCVFDALVRMGFWQMADGDYYVNGRWSWGRDQFTKWQSDEGAEA